MFIKSRLKEIKISHSSSFYYSTTWHKNSNQSLRAIFWSGTLISDISSINVNWSKYNAHWFSSVIKTLNLLFYSKTFHLLNNLSGKDAGSSTTESSLLIYFLDQLYVMKSKVQQLEKGEKEMKTALTSCERRIKVVENRKCLYKAKFRYLLMRDAMIIPISKYDCLSSISLIFKKCNI